MKRFILCALLLCATTHVGAEDSRPATIRVLVAERLSAPIVQVTGHYRIYNPQNGKHIGGSLFAKRRTMQPAGNGLSWDNSYNTHQITIQPTKETTNVLVNGQQYAGTVHFYRVGDTISVVNEVPIDYYCKVVMASQFPGGRDEEVMAAVAIASRTTATYEAARHAGHFWHVRADEVDFSGDAAIYWAPTAVRAVEETRGIVMEVPGYPGNAFPACWTVNCAGKTASHSTIFRSTIETQGVESKVAKFHREDSVWQVAVPTDWLTGPAKLAKVTGVEPYIDADSGKVYAIRLSDGVESKDIDFTTLQKIVGADRLKSTDFTAEMFEDRVLFRGYGEGYGVGICLYSAEDMAKHGKNASDILATFYPEADLSILPEYQQPGQSAITRLIQRSVESATHWQ